jgi:major membrane immunogen (membrane-anchored lipoprotein)
MPDSAIERTDTPPFQSDIQHQDLAIWDAEDQPCEHVVIEAVRYSCEDGQQPLPPTTENNNGNEDPSTQDSQQAAINDPWACINDHRSNICDQACILHSSNDKITNNHTQVETSSNEEGQVADLSVPITEECVAFAVVDKREFEHNTLSKDNTAAEPDSQTFKRDSRRKMSIRRLSDAFTRSKYPSSVEVMLYSTLRSFSDSF